jgi:hypothetical protein
MHDGFCLSCTGSTIYRVVTKVLNQAFNLRGNFFDTAAPIAAADDLEGLTQGGRCFLLGWHFSHHQDLLTAVDDIAELALELRKPGTPGAHFVLQVRAGSHAVLVSSLRGLHGAVGLGNRHA